jgi:hypothetical protein
VSETSHRAGFVITAKDELGKVLGNYGRQLLTLHQRLEMVKKDFAAVDAGALKGLGKQAEKMAMYVGSAQKAVSLGTENAKIAKLTAETDGRRLMLAEKLRGEEGKTNLLNQRMQSEAQSHENKLLNLAIARAAIRRRDDEASEMSARRIETTEIRLTMLRDRQMKAAEKAAQVDNRTADQKVVGGFGYRVASLLPAPGSRYAYGQQMVGQGVGMVGGVMNLANNDAVHHYLREQIGLGQMNLDATQGAGATAKLTNAAQSLRQQVGGMDMSDALDTMKDLVNITGKVSEATDPVLMKRFAQFKIANQVAYGLTGGQSYSALKAAELLAPNRAGMTDEQRKEGMMSRLELVNKVMAGTGNKVGPGEILQFAKRAQSSRFSLSQEGMLKLVPLMQELGGSQTGTALMSVMQNLANGRASHASMTNLKEMGLLNATVDGHAALEYDRQGRVKRMLPGALKGDDLLRSDPVAWVEKFLLPKTKGMDATHVDRLVNSIMGTRTAAGLISSIINQDSRINKDAGIIRGSKGIAASDDAQKDNYLRNELNYNKAMTSLRQQLAISVLPSLTAWTKALTGGLNALTNVLSHHPTLAKLAVGGTAAAGATVAVGGAGFMAKGAWDGLAFLGGGAKGIGKMLGMGGAAGAEGGAATFMGRLAPMVARLTPLFESLAPVISGVVDLIPGIGQGIALVTGAVIIGIASWKTNFLGFRSVASGIGHMIHDQWVLFIGSISWAFKGLGNTIKGVFNGIGSYLSTLLNKAPWLKDILSKAGAWANGVNKWAQDGTKKWADDRAKEDADDSAPPPQPTHVTAYITVNGAKGPHETGKAIRRHVQALGKARHPNVQHGGASATAW